MINNRNPAYQILGVLPPKKAEGFLSDWANMPAPWPLTHMDKESLQKFADSTNRIRRRYKELLGDPTQLEWDEHWAVGHLLLRDMLRRAWDTRDMREREWLCFKFRDSYASMARHERMSIEEIREEELAAAVTGPRYAAPPITPLEASLFYFQHQRNRTLRCPNVECPAPYFFASKKGQKFCSRACALPTRLESKRRWWAKHRAKLKKSKRRK
jgi:hypothetical protein